MYPYEKLQEWYQLQESAFYLFMPDKLLTNYQRMSEAFATYYPKVVIAYSYKTNYLPFLCQTLHRAGAYAEVVSRLEYDLAIKLGVDPSEIIFNGPLKREQDLIYALEQESMINLDSFTELQTVLDYADANQSRTIRIGLRVNIDLAKNSTSPLQNGYEVSRFGFCVENGNFLAALEQLSKQSNIKVVGLHGHFSTNRSLKVYETITRELCRLANVYLQDTLLYLDVGGGMYGSLPETFPQQEVPTYEEYAEVIGSIMQQELGTWPNQPLLIIEPGISLVADTLSFVCQVVDIKENRGSTFVTVDGSVHNIKPTMHPHPLPVKVIGKDERTREAIYHVVGYTCMEKDYLLCAHRGPLPQIGDFLMFSHVGAYTIVFQPPFIKERPPILALQQDEVFTIRKRETLSEFFPESLYVFDDRVKSMEVNR
ncbi:diaminopimelate decarboxylase [Brevibacillus ginsengisoli]|uniref:diaminopimelate decarboxylase n=1 Tax=Brevibacillus ginsengisoli TaxID=363854 RepID=UPI003CF27360